MPADHPAVMDGPEGVIATFQHRNESIHRHSGLSDPTCAYCNLVGVYAVKALNQAGYAIVRDEPDHYVTFDQAGWFVLHSVACRVAGTIGTCAYNDAIRQVAEDFDPDEHPDQLGTWKITNIDEEGLPSLLRVGAEANG